MYELQRNSPPSGGLQSIYISGGCLIPHAYLELGPFDEDLNLLQKTFPVHRHLLFDRFRWARQRVVRGIGD